MATSRTGGGGNPTGRRPARRPRLSTLARAALSPVFLVLLPVLWAAELLLFAGPLAVVVALRPWRRRPPTDEPAPPPRPPGSPPADRGRIIFDRSQDVSKIRGCNTRNVPYRWALFTDRLRAIGEHSGGGLRALDFGAGSLRDSFELATLGFQVDAVDVNAGQLAASRECYDWTGCEQRVRVHAGSLRSLPHQNRYDVILAFDVLEHLEELDATLAELRARLGPGGVLFVSVPNRLSLVETHARRAHARRSRRAAVEEAGVPHVNFKTPGEWRSCFGEAGYEICDQEMTIGFFVNDCWYGLYSLPLRYAVVDPLADKVAGFFGWEKKTLVEGLFYPAWLMRLVHELDLMTKKHLGHRWGWSLFVLRAKTAGRD